MLEISRSTEHRDALLGNPTLLDFHPISESYRGSAVHEQGQEGQP